MLSVGVLLSDLAHESGASFFDRIWPVFLVVFALFALVVLIVGVRGASRPDGEETDDEES
ncbi:MAG: hypothetical protein IH614_02440 [Desulfuromonadales bacterium]|nr:hypothetical protein [Desulfuromonadales bacterium]